MAEVPAANVYEPVRVRCGFCGEEESLPRDEAERVTALRKRLMQLRFATANTEAAAVGVANSIEHTTRMALPMALLVCVLPCLFKVPVALERGLSVGVILDLIAGPAVGMIMMGGVLGGSVLSRVLYRRELRPMLLAFPPSAGGEPLRCRVCGGNLPHVDGSVFVPCRYCAAQNLASPEIAARRDSDVRRELEAHRARAEGQAVAASKAASRMKWAAVAGSLGGVVAAALVSGVVYFVLSNSI